MPQFPNTKPKPDAAYVADMLAQLERLSTPRWQMLAYLIGMAKLEAEHIVRGED